MSNWHKNKRFHIGGDVSADGGAVLGGGPYSTTLGSADGGTIDFSAAKGGSVGGSVSADGGLVQGGGYGSYTSGSANGGTIKF